MLRALQFSAEVAAEFERLRALLKTDGSRQWEIADILTRLIDGHGLRIGVVAAQLGYRSQTLSMLYRVAGTFPPERRVAAPFHAHRLAAYAVQRVERAERLTTGETPTIDAGAVAIQLAASGIRQARPAVAFVQQQARSRRQLRSAARVFPNDGELVGRCHRGDCATIMRGRFEPLSVDLIHLDPPFAQYDKHEDGRHDMHCRDITKQTACDNNTAAEAVAVTVAAVRESARVIKDNGAILLWQASTTALRAPILQAIEEGGLEVEMMLIADKGIPQPGDPATAWTPQCEICYVLKRAGTYLVNHDDSPRGNVFRMSRIGECSHVFQKPEDVLEMLLGKHSEPNDLVVDAFGCSGSFCIAAHRLGRRWVYMESNEANYKWGASRVYEAVAAMTTATA